MKSKLFLLALSLVLISEAATAQRGRDNDRDRSQAQYDRNNNDDTEYGPRDLRLRHDHERWSAMPSRAFRQALSLVREERFDNDKLRMARMIARRNHLSTDQIRTIARQFNFDSSKLAFTKYAYASCIDPENYYALGRIFSFSSSREELYDYIARV